MKNSSKSSSNIAIDKSWNPAYILQVSTAAYFSVMNNDIVEEEKREERGELSSSQYWKPQIRRALVRLRASPSPFRRATTRVEHLFVQRNAARLCAAQIVRYACWS